MQEETPIQSLISYNTKSEICPIGFRNLGATCYFNALLQSLLSCTSFIEELKYRKDDEQAKYNRHPITKLLIEFIETSIYYEDLCQKLDVAESIIDDTETPQIRDLGATNDPDIVSTIAETKTKLQNYSPQIWKQMILLLCQKKKVPIQTFMQGQQCVGEGYHYLLETMENFQTIQNLFLHRYKSLIHCFDCERCVSDVECMYSLFEVEPNLKLEQIEKFQQYHIEARNMNEFLAKQSGYVDENYICPKCKKTGEKYRMNMLVMIPEVLVVMSKKYSTRQKLNVMTDFPERLEFKGKDGSQMVYEAVAQIEHSGGRHGGHYWAICRRKGGWFNINDMNVSPSEFRPTINTYIVFYHLK